MALTNSVSFVVMLSRCTGTHVLVSSQSDRRGTIDLVQFDRDGETGHNPRENAHFLPVFSRRFILRQIVYTASGSGE